MVSALRLGYLHRTCFLHHDYFSAPEQSLMNRKFHYI